MKIFIDFDDVIFNTKKFIADREEIFKRNDILPEVFNGYNEDLNQKNKDNENDLSVQYNLNDHLKYIEDHVGVRENLRNELQDLLKDAKSYVFNEFWEFAERAGKENLFLVSYGDPQFQKEKIKNSGVEEYFADVIVTDRPKSEAVLKKFKNDNKNIFADERIYFIDDRVKHLEDIKEEIPEITTVLMFSEDSRHKEGAKDELVLNKSCDGVIENLNGMVEILEKRNEIEDVCKPEREFCGFKKA